MTAVVEVGPAAVMGPNAVPAEWSSVALDGIDDSLALLDDQVVTVDEVWGDIFVQAAGGDVDSLVVVHPSWWPVSRVDRVEMAANAVAREVEVLSRAGLLRDRVHEPRAATVELGPELIVVNRPGIRPSVIARRDDLIADAVAVVATVGDAPVVHVDAPAGVDTAGALRTAITERMRVAVLVEDDQWVRRAVDLPRHELQPGARERGRRTGAVLHRRLTAVAAGVVVTTVVCGGFAVRKVDAGAHAVASTLLVEGRVGLMVPADWSVQRVTSGPGSARVQVVSPSDGELALHVTQSGGVASGDLQVTAEALHRALVDEPEGIFVDLDASDRRAGRAAVTHREVRRDHLVSWAVFVDRGARIAIGCQSAPGREELVRDACDEAIRSAHAIS